MAHEHSVFDTDPHFIISENERTIALASGTLPTIVQYDHNSERFTFELPRLIDGHDMTLCNDVRVNYINIDASTREGESGVYAVDDVTVSEADESKILFTWLLSGNATKFAGKLNFMVTFMCVDDEGKVTYRWNTLINSDITIGGGMDGGEIAEDEITDILAQWQAQIPKDIEKALSEAKESGEFDGPPGEKGEKGDPGEKGDTGEPGADGKDGADGYTPVKGTDYFTPEEVEQIAEEAAAKVPSDVFFAVYGKTTNAELLEAFNDGKTILCDYNNHRYYCSTASSIRAQFTCVKRTMALGLLSCVSNSWSNTETKKKTEISESSTDDEYPTTKAVYDYVNGLNIATVEDVLAALPTWEGGSY